ncbi:alpha-L-fucosidase [Luteolibacter arcticus]|uniref:alpha-L-fucosidase n=1 Tax=Luteolibacter arcticus TaxID=1581411 RepID=A0ABT3GLN1_9BACT|nr:alpha-L-fucosidase [Luteolibacter arcticus]MCW1924428.1 alpha-L-fucosidase [Luteolibacter arcticus]
MKHTLPLLLAISSLVSQAQQPGEGTAPPAAVKHWQDDRFGMFIHWGPVSLKGTEIGWSRGTQVPAEEYDNLYKRFDPTLFNADEWASVAKAAGMKYLVLTTKHHDGFCLWDTRQTDYNIMNTPFKRDVVKELAEACRKQQIDFGVYYSTCDWWHPLFPNASPGQTKPKADLKAYDAYLRAQTAELLTNYGPIFTMWFDVPQSYNSTFGIPMVAGLRKLQPDLMVNSRAYSLAGHDDIAHAPVGDYSTPEQKVGAFDMTRPWETCMTLCNQWAWRPNDPMKSLQQCLHTLIRTNGGNGNLLFNVGPMPDGRIEPGQVDRLREMGSWLAKNGESLYGTRGGPWKVGKKTVSTRKDHRIFIHVLDPAESTLELNALPVAIKSARLLNGPSIQHETSQGILKLEIPKDSMDPIDSIVELTIAGNALDLDPIPALDSSLIDPAMKATVSAVYQDNPRYAGSMAIDGKEETRWATPAGTGECSLVIDLLKPLTFARIEIDEAEGKRVKKFEFQAEQNGVWKTLHAGTELGAAFEAAFPSVTARKVRLQILEATEGPTIQEIRLFAPKR